MTKTEIEKLAGLDWESILTENYGKYIRPEFKDDKFNIRNRGQKLVIEAVQPDKTNGLYTSIFVKPCGSFIGKSSLFIIL